MIEEQFRQCQQIQEELSQAWIQSDPYFVYQSDANIKQCIQNWQKEVNLYQNRDILKHTSMEIIQKKYQFVESSLTEFQSTKDFIDICNHYKQNGNLDTAIKLLTIYPTSAQWLVKSQRQFVKNIISTFKNIHFMTLTFDHNVCENMADKAFEYFNQNLGTEIQKHLIKIFHNNLMPLVFKDYTQHSSVQSFHAIYDLPAYRNGIDFESCVKECWKNGTVTFEPYPESLDLYELYKTKNVV